MSEGKSYFPALDGLRLLASLNIVLLHLESSMCLPKVADWPILGRIVQGPMFSASLFFVLGGFIYFHLLSPKFATLSSWKFFKGRIQKLYPLHFIATALMVYVFWYRQIYEGDFGYLMSSMLSHLTLLWAFAPLQWFSLNEPSWALTAFFVAYASLGWVGRRLLQMHKNWQLLFTTLALFIPTLLAMLYWGQHSFSDELKRTLHVQPILRALEFFFGMTLARWFQIRPITFHSTWGRDVLVFLGFGLGFPLMFLIKAENPWWDYLGRHVLAVWLFGFLIWNLARNQGRIANFLAHPWIRFVGKGSFYPYLLHLPLMGLTKIIVMSLGFKNFFVYLWQDVLFLVLLYGISAWYTERKKLN